MSNFFRQSYRSLFPKWISSGHLSLWIYFCACIFTVVCLPQANGSTKMQEESIEDEKIKKWTEFNEKLQSLTNGKVPLPFGPVEKLASLYLREPCNILDIGCETGRNSACLIRRGHEVVILDIAPNAVEYTVENLKMEGLEHGIKDSIVSKIEDLPANYGPFKAVVGTYVFSFIPPSIFTQTMKDNILKRVSRDGYFVGGFFGEEHAWAMNKDLTIVSVKELESLFSSQGFSIIEISEQIEEVPTVSGEITKFHTIHVIAHKTL